MHRSPIPTRPDHQPAEPVDSSPCAGHPGTDTRIELLAGARSMLPWLAGVMPFGFLIGVTTTTTGRPVTFGLLTGLGIYSGSAQLTALQLLASGAGVATVVISVLVLNARLLIYAGSLTNHWQDTTWRFRALAAYLLVDPSFAEAARRYRERPDGAHWFYLGTASTLWIAWQTSIVAGALGGAAVPPDVGLAAVIPLFLLAELVRAIRDGATGAAALVAAVVASCSTWVPLHGGLIVAIVAGIVTGVAVRRRTP